MNRDRTGPGPDDGPWNRSNEGEHRKAHARPQATIENADSSDTKPAVLDQRDLLTRAESKYLGAADESPSRKTDLSDMSVVEDEHPAAATPKVPGSEENAEKAVEPTLEAYFGPDVVQVSAFVKTLKNAKIRKFGAADTSAAEDLVAENDKDGSMLWQLVAHASSLHPVSIWVWPFIQNRVNRLVGAQIDISEQSPTQIICNVVTAISGPLNGDDRQGARRAENDLRLAIAWLLERRNADVTDIAEPISHLFINTEGEVEGRVRKAMAVGSKVELQATIAALFLAGDQIRNAKRERDLERRERFDLKVALDSLREETASRGESIRRLEGEKAKLERQLDEERRRADGDRRHHAHSSSQTRADFSTSVQRVKGLVEEAGEAVQIAMKRADEGSLRGLQAAERRITSAVDAISEIGK
ncbi:CLK4-associating serine/arginine rich family protein [Mesorhizobium sp. M0317]|uniref:hypothetical protein n=1 Tax=Mesorhizobium sp. M0317 TaxID=2956935 RepID=UPI0033375DC2